MEFTFSRQVQITAYLLLVLAVTQALYTGLYVAEVTIPRQLLWGLEAVLFTFLIAFAGAAMAQTQNHHLGWSAIAFSAVLNVVQVAIGLALFGPFREVAGQLDATAPLAGSVLVLSFMIYYAAKLLLGFAAVVFGMSLMKGNNRSLGGVTAIVGGIAVAANTILIVFGRDGFLPSPFAGGFGVLATLLLALCLLRIAREE